jgi:hypothetical protein
MYRKVCISQPLSLQDFFFERTTLDESVFIDIADKYKIISLGSYNQAKKKSQKQYRWVGLGYQHALNSTLLNNSSQSDRGIDTSCITRLQWQLCPVENYSTQQAQQKPELAAPTKTSTLM